MYPNKFYTTYTKTIAALCKEYEYAQIEDTSSHVEVDTANGIVRAVDPVEESVLRDQHYAITRIKLGRLDNLLARDLTATKEYSQIIDSLRPYVNMDEMLTRYDMGYQDPDFVRELEFKLLHDDVSYIHSNNTYEIEEFIDYLKNQSYYGIHQIYEDDRYGTTICIDAKNRFYVTMPSSIVLQNAENQVESPSKYRDRIANEFRYYKMVQEGSYEVYEEKGELYAPEESESTFKTVKLKPDDCIITDKFHYVQDIRFTSLQHLDYDHPIIPDLSTSFIRTTVSKQTFDNLLENQTVQEISKEEALSLSAKYSLAELKLENRFYREMRRDDIIDDICEKMNLSNQQFYETHNALYNDALPGFFVSSIYDKEVELHAIVKDEAGLRMVNMLYFENETDSFIASWQPANLSIEDAEQIINELPEREDYVNCMKTLYPNALKNTRVRNTVFQKLHNIASNAADTKMLKAEVYVDLLESIDDMDDTLLQDGIEYLVEKTDSIIDVLQLSEKYEKMHTILELNQDFEQVKKEASFEKFFDEDLSEAENYELLQQDRDRIYNRHQLLQDVKRYITRNELYWQENRRGIVMHAFNEDTIRACTDKLQEYVEQKILSDNLNAIDLTMTYQGEKVLGKTTLSANDLNRYYSLSHLNRSTVLSEAVKEAYGSVDVEEELMESISVPM